VGYHKFHQCLFKQTGIPGVQFTNLYVKAVDIIYAWR
jgi:hypothetical protein